ncbi:ABC transporter ATP-binding protein [Gardnerella sp. DNF01162]|uniref:nickel ABC transporter ATP-binding protein NikE n=1 Tax=Gardnerella TaxID=2701 RepID=UPI000C9AF5F2|nr:MULTISPECIES: ABC transporter ATP-binding protein [Gardnerella]PMC44701.1 ABC transporter ATP-binding protein [Gardnerella vaginalis]MDK6295357.1 ABC transporter ATP-binding protein [Gardnerella swidsinskii]MDK8691771.1 ABC transporter ATP-binding protein [Gardnerella swidsinskii]PNP90825.1 ABC transporter ATP-binding protein [Gardnerella sp. DNF01162]RFD73341.1 ABC transporter ATP-binding protein [Gardnerella vaginalis]
MTNLDAQALDNKDLDARKRIVISVEDLSVSIDGRQITRNVSMRLRAGMVSALVGESGSGKSLTALALMGLLDNNARVEGNAALLNASDANESFINLLSEDASYEHIRGGMIGMIFQEPSSAFNPVKTIGKQIEEALIYHPEKAGKLSQRERKKRVISQLLEVELSDAERVYRSYPHELSGGQLQRAMIAMALINRPQVLIADEPTTALDITTQRDILRLIRNLSEKLQLAVLIITHDMSVVRALADEMYVMQGGNIVESGEVQHIFANPKHEYTRTLLDSVPKFDMQYASSGDSYESIEEVAKAIAKNIAKNISESPGSESPVVEVQGVSVKYSHARFSKNSNKLALANANLRINSGSTLALVGESGAGKTTIAKLISGQIKPNSGLVLLNGENLNRLNNKARRQALSRIGYVFQDSGSALNPRKTIGWSIAEPLLLHTNLDANERLERVEEMLNQVQLPVEFASRFPHELSGGQRQRVGIARALILQPSLLIVDEPTSALDVTVQRCVLNLLHDLQQKYRYACLFITHDVGVVQEVASEVAIIRNGSVQYIS